MELVYSEIILVHTLIAFECPEIDAPLGANVEKSREGFRIYCDDDRQRSLDLRCEAGHWIPEINLTCPTFSIDPLASSPGTELEFKRYLDKR